MIAITILGEPASKANSRQIVTINERPSVIKSKKARSYEHDALRQIPVTARQRLQGPVRVTLRIFYASERPDLDESIVLDVLQDRWGKREEGTRPLLQAGVYRNDRQVREKHVYHGIDKRNPRAEIEVEALVMQQQGLELTETETADERSNRTVAEPRAACAAPLPARCARASARGRR
jgi:Holliday junction resolvase RusA-like endonuclease